MKNWIRFSVVVLSATLGSSLFAWDYEGHRIVNQLGLAGLPEDFPAFVREPAAAERIAFLAGEPDRWRNVQDLPIKHGNGLDHYCDFEYLAKAGLDHRTISPLRYQFVAEYAAGRAANADAFAPINPAKNTDHSQEWSGFAPWMITEMFGKLKSGFSYLKALEDLGTPEEVENARANILYIMGVMGHYVGDLAQPLHTTEHFNGWVGDNPNNYTRWNGFHAWIDGGFIGHAGIGIDTLRSQARPGALLAPPAHAGRAAVSAREGRSLRSQEDACRPRRGGFHDGPVSQRRRDARQSLDHRLAHRWAGYVSARAVDQAPDRCGAVTRAAIATRNAPPRCSRCAA